MKLLSIFILNTILFASCIGPNKKIVSEQDVKKYLQVISTGNKDLIRIIPDISFWKKRLAANEGDLISQLKLGSLYGRLFNYSGSVNDIHSL